MKRNNLTLAACALASGLLASVAPAFAQGKITCKFGVLGNADFPGTIGMQRMADRINAESKGAIEVQVFPNSQLGGEKEMAEGMRLGSVCGAPVNVSVLSIWVPEGQLFDMPFLFRDDGHLLRALERRARDDDVRLAGLHVHHLAHPLKQRAHLLAGQ